MHNGPEHVEYEFSSGGCRVDPLIEADEVDLSDFEAADGFQEFLERAPQAIEANDGDGVIGSGLIKQGYQIGPIECHAGDHVFEHANSAVL